MFYNFYLNFVYFKLEIKFCVTMFCVSVGDLVGSQDTKIEQVPILRKKERKYNGMFEFKKGDENIIIRHLLCGKL